MYFFKSTLLTVFAACCISYTTGQLEKYDKLSADDLKELCKKNGVDESKLAEVHVSVDALLNENVNKPITSKDALKTDCDCMGPNLKVLLKQEMDIVKSCLQGQITLSDEDTKTLTKRSVKKLCALSRLSSFEKTLSGCIDTDLQGQCETAVLAPVDALDNSDEFANLGLTYSPQGKKVWDDLYDCSSKSVTKCDADQQKTHLQLSERMKETMIARN